MAKQAVKTESEESNRMWASASFVGVLIIIGLPLWWKTTEVYRVALPYDKIEAFNSLSHYVSAELFVLANDEATAAEMAGLVEKAFEDSDVIKLQITKSVLPEALHQSLDYVADEHEAVEEVASKYPLTEHNKFYLVQRRVLFQDVWLAGERVMFFRDAKASTTAVSALKQWVYQTHTLTGARAVSADDARRVRVPPSEHYTILVHTDYELNMEKEFHDYIGSFADELSDLHNFTITMQSLYMLNFNYNAREVKDSPLGRHYAMRQSNLPLLLTKLEETAPRVPSKAAVNLALCRTPCSNTPIYIYDDYDFLCYKNEDELDALLMVIDNPIIITLPSRMHCTDASYPRFIRKTYNNPHPMFMSPKWGGVVFHNPTQQECENGEWKPDVSLIMRGLIKLTTEKPITTLIPAFMSPKWGGVVFHNPTQQECESGEWKPDVRLIMGGLIKLTTEKPITTPIPAFMSPKWGGVVFHNPTQQECESGEWKPDVRLIMGAFVTQLRALLGIVDKPPIPSAYLEPLRSVSPRSWEVDTLLRIRTLEQITSAERTLQSLAQLLGEISNIVINDEVGASINAGVDHTQLAASLARSGQLLAGYSEALAGAAAAEAAFMGPSLLALLYFPDDQKYAIYIPLFLPIMFPVFLSLKNLIAWFRGKPIHKEKTE